MDKYEISLWEDAWIEDQGPQGGSYKEQKICVIGTDDMTSQARALEPKLVENINGTRTFSFKIYKRYIDNVSGESVLNPFSKYLINERKVKVKWKDEWYDFVIKKIQENNSDKSISYNCTDLFIHELSKTGYDLNFDTELRNNIGSAQYLIEQTLENSGWEFDLNGSDQMIQTVNSAVLETTALADFIAINQTDFDTEFQVYQDSPVLIFYDNIIDMYNLEIEDYFITDIQLVCNNESFITELNSNLVIDNYCLLVKNVKITKVSNNQYKFELGNVLIFQVSGEVSLDYRGERYKNTEIEEFDEDLNRYVVKCDNLDTENPNDYVYRTIITKEDDSVRTTNLVSNPTDFKDTAGWYNKQEGNRYYYTLSPYQEYISAVRDEKELIRTYPDDYPEDISFSNLVIGVKKELSLSGTVHNTGFISNASSFSSTSRDKKLGLSGGISPGDKFTFRYKAYENMYIEHENYENPSHQVNTDYEEENSYGITWRDYPVYIYKDTFTNPYKNSGPSDEVGRLLSFYSLTNKPEQMNLPPQFWKNSDFLPSIFKVGELYTIHTYENREITFGLQWYGAIEIVNHPSATQTIIDSPIDYDYQLNSEYYYYFGFEESDKLDFSKCTLTLFATHSETTTINLDGIERQNVTTQVKTSGSERVFKLNKTPQQIFGPTNHNLLYNFIGELIYRYKTSPVNYDSSLHFLNAHTFTSGQFNLFYQYNDEIRYRPNTCWASGNGSGGVAPVDGVRAYVTLEEPVSHESSYTYGPDFVQENNFYVYVDKDKKGFYMLITNIAERILIDPPLSVPDLYKYEAISAKLNEARIKDNQLQALLNNNYYYSDDLPDEITVNTYVIYESTNKVYDSETNTWKWGKYKDGDYVAHLYKCISTTNNFTNNFDSSDTAHWQEVVSDFPFGIGDDPKGSLEKNSPYYLKNEFGQYVTDGYVFWSEEDLYNLTGIEKPTAEQLAQIGMLDFYNVPEHYQSYGGLMSKGKVYSLGAYHAYNPESPTAYEYSSISGQYNKLLLNTFKPLIADLERLLLLMFNPETDNETYYAEIEPVYIDRIDNYYRSFHIQSYANFDRPITVANNNTNLINLILNFNGDSIFEISNPVDEDGWVSYTLTSVQSIASKQVVNIEFAIQCNTNIIVWLENAQLFKNQYKDGQLMTPDTYVLSDIERLYAYYTKDGNTINYLYIDKEPLNKYPPQTSEYQKRATINIKQSNRFNILQTIAEAFNGWIYFYINHDETGHITNKYVGIKQLKGQETGLIFEYGIDLKSIQRTIDSSEMVTKVYVLQNSNEFAQDGFCTITRSRQNLSKAPFILDFSYYMENNLINKEELSKYLYNTYYPELNKYYNLYDERSAHLILMKEQLSSLNVEYIIEKGKSDAAAEVASNLIYELTTLDEGFFEIPSNNNKIKNLRTSLNQANSKAERYENSASGLHDKINDLQNDISDLEEEIEYYKTQLDTLNNNFYSRYSSIIFEGTWIDEKYINDDEYYLDALMTTYNSSHPQLSYTINLIRVSSLEEFRTKIYKVGDICSVIDRDFFGYDSYGTPHKEKIIIYEVTSYFDSPEKDTITVRNYRSGFDDLFQKVVAATQQLKFAEGQYSRVAGSITPDKIINYDLLQNTFDHNKELILNSSNQDVIWDENGITITDKENTADKTRIIAGGIFITNDGGATWKNAVRGDGISADLLTAGRINTGEIYIYNKLHPMFRWDGTGISAYASWIGGHEDVPMPTVDFSKFVRFDMFGIYGYNKPANHLYDRDTYAEDFIPLSEEEIWQNEYTKFGLTWRGFFLKAGRPDGGYVKITTDGDIIKKINGSEDRKIISSGHGDVETFYLTENGDAMFSGELRAATGTFTGQSTTSLFTLNDEGLVLKIIENGVYTEKFKTGYTITNNIVYPYLELVGNNESSIIMQNENDLFIGLKNFIGRDGLKFGKTTNINGGEERGVFVDYYYIATNGETPSKNVLWRETYNLGKILHYFSNRFSTGTVKFYTKREQVNTYISEVLLSGNNEDYVTESTDTSGTAYNVSTSSE